MQSKVDAETQHWHSKKISNKIFASSLVPRKKHSIEILWWEMMRKCYITVLSTNLLCAEKCFELTLHACYRKDNNYSETTVRNYSSCTLILQLPDQPSHLNVKASPNHILIVAQCRKLVSKPGVLGLHKWEPWIRQQLQCVIYSC